MLKYGKQVLASLRDLKPVQFNFILLITLCWW